MTLLFMDVLKPSYKCDKWNNLPHNNTMMTVVQFRPQMIWNAVLVCLMSKQLQ